MLRKSDMFSESSVRSISGATLRPHGGKALDWWLTRSFAKTDSTTRQVLCVHLEEADLNGLANAMQLFRFRGGDVPLR